MKRVVEKPSGDVFVVYVTHLDHLYMPDGWIVFYDEDDLAVRGQGYDRYLPQNWIMI
jgi:hypothetical protein